MDISAEAYNRSKAILGHMFELNAKCDDVRLYFQLIIIYNKIV
jgi:hypothetical protein